MVTFSSQLCLIGIHLFMNRHPLTDASRDELVVNKDIIVEII